MREYHSSQLLALEPPPVEYLIEGLLPIGGGGDISGMPGEGKSTVLLSMASAISCGTPWLGLKTRKTPVAWISGEASGKDAIARDLHRLGADLESDILFLLPDPNTEMFSYYNYKGMCAWITTPEGRRIIDRVRSAGCGFVVLDTIGSLCAGLVEINNDQTRQLARHLTAELAGLTWLTISHTNQSSSKDKLDWRLHYLSRAGGNGFPGAVRWAAGIAAVRESDYDQPSVSLPPLKDDMASRRLVAFGVSKHNEMPAPYWTNRRPAILEIQADGRLILVRDGREDAAPSEPQKYVNKQVQAVQKVAHKLTTQRSAHDEVPY